MSATEPVRCPYCGRTPCAQSTSDCPGEPSPLDRLVSLGEALQEYYQRELKKRKGPTCDE